MSELFLKRDGCSGIEHKSPVSETDGLEVAELTAP